MVGILSCSAMGLLPGMGAVVVVVVVLVGLVGRFVTTASEHLAQVQRRSLRVQRKSLKAGSED
jgi:hypothetical protein